MNALTLGTAFVAALSAIALFLCFSNRRLLLDDGSPMPAKAKRMPFLAVNLTALAALGGLGTAVSSGWSGVYTVLPLLILALYVLEIYAVSRLSARWRRSPLFWMAVLPPVLGCILVIMILSQDRHEGDK